MRVQVWKIQKQFPDDPDYIVKQKQRTGADDGSPGYETVNVGTGRKYEAPDGTPYIDLTINGFNNNKPK